METRLDLRRAAAPDVEAILALTREAYAKWVPLIGREPKPMTADYGRAVREHMIDLLYADFELVGLIEMIVAEDHLLIENVAVAPGFQGRGLGKTLLAHAEDVARLLGLPQVRLYTNQKFAENIALYQSLGYGVDREEALEVAVAVHMSKPVAL